ncbi:hypothetical protein [Flammeovirga sp. SubArs3]|uniref:hypothetical protein n=1 Tax=Flammeovirga sp. SubArs3 TaxID=2995316 RepID=UPI00248B7F77|nr:hypothetical protein [Flammeovirga sp. SubArs3]
MKIIYFLLFLICLPFKSSAFDLTADIEAFCINDIPSVPIVITITHSADESFHSITGYEELGSIIDTVYISSTETKLGVLVNDEVTVKIHTLAIEMINSSAIVSSNTIDIDVFGLVKRTVYDINLSYDCSLLSISFKTEGDVTDKEVVRIYVDDKFFREQSLTIDNNIGTLSNLLIDRPATDTLYFKMYLESSRNSSCLESQWVQEISFVSPLPQATISSSYSPSDEVYGEVTFNADSSINTGNHLWEIYENDVKIDEVLLPSEEELVYTFATSNFDKGVTSPFKKYSVILIATDAEEAENCNGFKDTLDHVQVPYFPRVKVPTAVSVRSSFGEDNVFKLKIRENVGIYQCNVRIFAANQKQVYESNDINFVFGDNEEFTETFYTAQFSLLYDDGYAENFQSSFIITP